MIKLVDALLGKKKTKDFSLNGHKYTLQTLSAGEQADIAQLMSGLDFLAKLERSRIHTVARSLVSIDDVPLDSFSEVREKLRSVPNQTTTEAVEAVIRDMDSQAIADLYDFYDALMKENLEEREKAKNFSRDQQGVSSGKSVPNSAQPLKG